MSTSATNILTVSALTQQIKSRLEGRFSSICLEGEISNFKQQSSGHLYFTLKDSLAQISAVFFKGNTLGLSRLPKEGDKVTVQGEISVYAPRGNYQIIIRSMQFSGVGDILLMLHERKRRLQAMGWFDQERKKPLPKLPKTIGVITSETGAVIQDIIHVLRRRHAGFHLLLNPVRVQGPEAAEEIASAINQMNRYNLADVLIVGRGGGSLEDLLPFSDERVAEAIFNSKIPIISAVGHESDYSIADFVADRRAPTPSAAAEIVVFESTAQQELLQNARMRLRQMIRLLTERYRQQLLRYQNHPIFSSPEHFLGRFYQMLDPLPGQMLQLLRQKVEQERLKLTHKESLLSQLKPETRIAVAREKLISVKFQIENLFKASAVRARERLNQLGSHLTAINPKNLLSQGYGIIFRENSSSVILSVNEVKEGDHLSLMLLDGTITTKATKITPIS